MKQPLCVDLFCGLGGWAEGFLAEGYWVVGFDIEHHDYGTGTYPGDFVMQDVLTLHGSQFKHAAVIVASPPCQAYSYRAMPWKRAKALPPPDNTLFEACFRIQREASEAAGHHIPLIVENVCGAQRWVGRAKWHFGSYYLWGDVPALMPITLNRRMKYPTSASARKWSERPIPRLNDGESSIAHRGEGVKAGDRCLDKDTGKWTTGWNVANAQVYREGVKQGGSGAAWFDGTSRDKMLGDKSLAAFSSRSDSRKAASAHIAKIPFALAQWIARCFAS